MDKVNSCSQWGRRGKVKTAEGGQVHKAAHREAVENGAWSILALTLLGRSTERRARGAIPRGRFGGRLELTLGTVCMIAFGHYREAEASILEEWNRDAWDWRTIHCSSLGTLGDGVLSPKNLWFCVPLGKNAGQGRNQQTSTRRLQTTTRCLYIHPAGRTAD